jgi:hypothetical protein
MVSYVPAIATNTSCLSPLPAFRRNGCGAGQADTLEKFDSDMPASIRRDQSWLLVLLLPDQIAREQALPV